MTSDFSVNMNEYLPLRDVVFNTLRQAILKGELKPGERLMEIALAERLGVSRTPIREAMRKLEQEGLVVMIPRRGAQVANITEKDLNDVLEVRKQIYRYRVEYLKEGETRDVLVKEHEELTKAIRERDVERAKQLSFQHIENQRMAIMRSIEAEDAERERAEKEKSRGHR